MKTEWWFCEWAVPVFWLSCVYCISSSEGFVDSVLFERMNPQRVPVCLLFEVWMGGKKSIGSASGKMLVSVSAHCLVLWLEFNDAAHLQNEIKYSFHTHFKHRFQKQHLFISFTSQFFSKYDAFENRLFSEGAAWFLSESDPDYKYLFSSQPMCVMLFYVLSA